MLKIEVKNCLVCTHGQMSACLFDWWIRSNFCKFEQILYSDSIEYTICWPVLEIPLRPYVLHLEMVTFYAITSDKDRKINESWILNSEASFCHSPRLFGKILNGIKGHFSGIMCLAIGSLKMFIINRLSSCQKQTFKWNINEIGMYN